MKYKYVKPIKQFWSNDCAIAAVSMATGVPYAKVLMVAKTHYGFKPGAVGCYIHELLDGLGLDFNTRINLKRRKRSIPIKQPCIVSIPSLNIRKGFHAVVVCNGVVYDPSGKRTASFNYVLRSWRSAYYGFVKVND